MTEPTEADELAFAIRDVSELRVGISAQLGLVLDAARRELARMREPKPAPPLAAIDYLRLYISAASKEGTTAAQDEEMRVYFAAIEAYVKARHP